MKTCTHCKLTKPMDEFHVQLLLYGGRRNQCKTCSDAVRRIRRAKPEKRRAELDRDNQRRRESADYRERHRLHEKERREADPEAFHAYRRDYYARKLKSNRVLLTEEEKRANARAALRRHWQNNRQQYRTRTLNYIARKRNALGTHTAADVAFMVEYQQFRCFWCSDDISGGHHVDHIIPLSKGGTNGPENLVASCDPCNRSKGAKLPKEFLRYRELRIKAIGELL